MTRANLNQIVFDEKGNIERYFTYSDFLDYINVPPAKDGYSHIIANPNNEDVLDFLLEQTARIAPFDNIDMNDNEYVRSKLANRIKNGHLFDLDDVNSITRERSPYQNDEEKKNWLVARLHNLMVPMPVHFQLIDWASFRADDEIFYKKDTAAINSLKLLRRKWRGYYTSGTDFRFCGTENFDQALSMARYGWTEKLDKIRNLEIQIPPTYKTVLIPETKFSVAGNSVNVGRYLTGIPDCMHQTHRKLSEYADVTHRHVKIVVNITVSWKLGEDDIFNWGKDIASVINALESNNVSTKIVLMHQVQKKEQAVDEQEAPQTHTTFITLKDYKENFYLEKLMFPLAHRSFIRRLIFAAQERESEDIRKTFEFYHDGGYGIPGNTFDDSDENTLYFNAAQYEQDKTNAKLAKILKSRDTNFMQMPLATRLER